MRSKKHRQWSETHEHIMKLYLQLCTELQRSLSAKDGLYQYRNICKDTNLNSFKKVIEGFLGLAELKASTAREESAQTVLDIEDLDAIQTPERYMCIHYLSTLTTFSFILPSPSFSLYLSLLPFSSLHYFFSPFPCPFYSPLISSTLSVLLSTVSGEDTQDRTDRIMLMPWVKFLWESFRNVLELLKNNRQLEVIYVHVAKRGK